VPDLNMILLDNTSENHLKLSISQAANGMVLGLRNLQPFLTSQPLKSLFIHLIQCDSNCLDAQCGNGISEILERNFTHNDRRSKTILSWLQYFGKEELENRGGFAAFESNPYVQTQRIHDGLLVQVGDSLDVFDTPEGEQLLVNAINALPPLKV
jgi:hypothetical protein